MQNNEQRTTNNERINPSRSSCCAMHFLVEMVHDCIIVSFLPFPELVRLKLVVEIFKRFITNFRISSYQDAVFFLSVLPTANSKRGCENLIVVSKACQSKN